MCCWAKRWSRRWRNGMGRSFDPPQRRSVRPGRRGCEREEDIAETRRPAGRRPIESDRTVRAPARSNTQREMTVPLIIPPQRRRWLPACCSRPRSRSRAVAPTAPSSPRRSRSAPAKAGRSRRTPVSPTESSAKAPPPSSSGWRRYAGTPSSSTSGLRGVVAAASSSPFSDGGAPPRRAGRVRRPGLRRRARRRRGVPARDAGRLSQRLRRRRRHRSVTRRRPVLADDVLLRLRRQAAHTRIGAYATADQLEGDIERFALGDEQPRPRPSTNGETR